MVDHISSAAAGSPLSAKQDIEALEVVDDYNTQSSPGLNVAHMTPEHRARVEKRLKRKLDARCGLFVLIYIMNYLDVSIRTRPPHDKSQKGLGPICTGCGKG